MTRASLKSNKDQRQVLSIIFQLFMVSWVELHSIFVFMLGESSIRVFKYSKRSQDLICL